MNIISDVSLANYSTMRLGGIASFLCEVRSREDLVEAIAWAHERHLPVRMVGSGSNIVWQDSGFNGVILVNKIMGFTIQDAADNVKRVTIGAGENWDNAVARTVTAGLTGIEALSLIPGTSGATPIQNVGAYGQDISQTLTSVEVFDSAANQFTSIPNQDCHFGYRTSAFKSEYAGRYFVSAITLQLHLANPLPPYYGAVQTYLETNHVDGAITPSQLRAAVIAIRSAKLPNPERIANNGSFFANPIVESTKLAELLKRYPTMPNWPQDGGRAKLPAAWLIEQAGFKDFHDAETGMATWHLQPLVLINEHAKSTSDLLNFKQKLVTAVHESFGITLEQEPELLP